MTATENSNGNPVQGLSEKMKRLLLESDDLTPSEKSYVGGKGHSIHRIDGRLPPSRGQAWTET